MPSNKNKIINYLRREKRKAELISTDNVFTTINHGKDFATQKICVKGDYYESKTFSKAYVR